MTNTLNTYARESKSLSDYGIRLENITHMRREFYHGFLAKKSSYGCYSHAFPEMMEQQGV